MINSIDIFNFQSHKVTNLELSEGVNVIVGKSDSGKTAILRALNWVINNRPLGDSFKSNWGGDTFASLSVDGIDISREKGKKNLYVISTKKQKGFVDNKEFEAFKADVPAEVNQILNMSDINLHEQHDIPFLLFKSPGETAKYINTIVDLDIIDRSLGNIASVIREEKQQLKHLNEDGEDLREKLTKYDWIDEAKKEIDELKIIEVKIEEDKKKRNEIEDILSEIVSKRGKLKEIQSITKFRKEVEDLIKLDDEINRQVDEYNALNDIIEKLETRRERLNEVRKNKKKLKEKFDKLMPDICPLCGQEIK